MKQVRSILEFAVPVWHSSITGDERLDIERIQKSAFHIILGSNYQSYSSALKVLGMETLNSRRTKLCKKFATKSVKNSKFKKWFKVNKKVSFTRQAQPKYCRVYSRTVRFEKSPLSYLTSILNSMKWMTDLYIIHYTYCILSQVNYRDIWRWTMKTLQLCLLQFIFIVSYR